MRTPILEGWRGLAAALVVLSHYGPALGVNGPVVSLAFTGVDVFFVISGMVFGPVLMGGAGQGWLAFGLRRATRILPAYWLTLAGYLALHWTQYGVLGPWAQHLLFIQLESRETAFALNPAFWSLVPEVQFYIAMPLLAWIINGRSWRLWALTLTALMARLMLSVYADREAADPAFLLLHQLPGMLVEFLVGTLLWAFCNRNGSGSVRPEDHARFRRFGGVCALAWLVLATWFHHEGNAIEHVLGVAGASLLAAFCAAGMILGSLTLTLNHAWSHWCRRLGAVSYPLYLVHVGPLKLWTGQPELALGVSLALAVTIHFIVEEPVRLWGRRLSERILSRSEDIR